MKALALLSSLHSADIVLPTTDGHEIRRRALAPHLMDFSFLEWSASRYGQAHQSAIESLAMLNEELEGNRYLSAAYQRCRFIIPWSLLFLGRWGEALREIEAAIAIAEKNGDDHRVRMIRNCQAWIHLHAMDFNGVVAICASAVPAEGILARSYYIRLGRTLAGSAETALGNYDRALGHFLAAQAEFDRQPVLFDWYRRLLLESGLTELWLAKKNVTEARCSAERFLSLALATAESTWHALAWEANARVAMTEGTRERSQLCVSEALKITNNSERPVSAWRVHATASDVYRQSGSSDMSRNHREISQEMILKLATSLAPEERLRKTFLSAPSLSKILAETGVFT